MSAKGGCCDLVDDGSGIFKPLKKRCCTDILCLLLFLVYTAVMIVIAIFSLNNGSLNYLWYSRDYKDQFCGIGIHATRPKVFYPRLAKDLIAQSTLFAVTGPLGFVNFRPYTLCVDACPSAFALSAPHTYGGPSYPNANATDPTFYALSRTADFFNRCLPIMDQNPGLNRYLCGVPSCGVAIPNTHPVASCRGVTPACTSVASDPSATNAWVTDAATTACCSMRVHEMNTQTFLPPDADAKSLEWEKWFASYIGMAYGMVNAASNSRTEIFVMGLGAPFALCFCWFILLFLLAGFIIIFALLFFLFVMLAITFYFFYKAGWTGQLAVSIASLTNLSAPTSVFPAAAAGGSDLSQTWYAVLGVVMAILTICYLIFLILSRQSIMRCISIVRETTKVFFSLPFMAAWPMVEITFTLGVLLYAFAVGGLIATQNPTQFSEIVAAVNTASNGTVNAASAFSGILSASPTTRITILMVIHIIGCIWGLFIAQSAAYTTLARSAAVFFFSHAYDESKGEVVQKGRYIGGVRVVLACAWCVFSRHLGSVAFGAAILTIMTIVRLVLSTIDYYTRDAQAGNCCLKLTMKCAQCCLWCLDKTVKFITFYGFIFVAIEGSTFCGACIATFGFIVKYPAQLAVNRLVGNLLRLAISISIPAVCAVTGWFWIGSIVPKRPNPIVPVVIIALCSGFIASAITDVFRCCIDTIFVCSFKDMEEHTPPKFMPTSMQKSFGLDNVEKGGPKITKTEGVEEAKA